MVIYPGLQSPEQTYGALWYSTDDGATWLDVGAVSETEPQLLAADANTRLYFQPAADFNGTISDVISFKAWDSANAWEQVGEELSGVEANDQFGHGLSLSDDGLVMAVGAYNAENQAGLVQVYSRETALDRWTEMGSNIVGDVGDASG